jgi:predicted transcriptional regulator
MQMNIIVQLLDYWVDPGRRPFPGKEDIAKRIGVTGKTIQINMRALERAGLVRREIRRADEGDFKSNVYHLDGLIQRVKHMVEDFAKEKALRAAAKRGAETPKGLRKASPENYPGRMPGAETVPGLTGK